MAIKLAEQTNGPHIFMRLRLDSGRVEEIDAYTTEKGWHYVNQLQLSRPADRQDILRYVQKEQYHIPYLALMIPALSP